MKSFYSVITTSGNSVIGQWYYHEKQNAEKKFETETEKIKKRWGYYDYDEGDLGDEWTITDTYTEFYSRDEGGDDDFLDRTEIKEVKFED